MRYAFSLLTALLLAPLVALHASDPSASPTRPVSRMPAFSWDHVQGYVHIRKDTAFTPDEIRYLSTFPLIAFEKTTGSKDSGSTEAGTLKAARAIKACLLYTSDLPTNREV